MVKPKRGGGRPPRAKGKKHEPASIRADDVYEAEDSEPDEERHASRYDRVDTYEYEMPSDFEDEDIDDEMAFTEEDKKMFGHLFDDEGPTDDADDDGGGSGSDMLDSGESGSEGEEGSEGDKSEEEGEEEDGGRQRTAKQQRDELDELFGEDASGDSGSEGGSEDERSDQSGSGDEGDEDAAARHKAMLDAVRGGDGADKRRRRAREVVLTEAYPESAYNLPPSASGELTVSDLIAGLGDGKAKLGPARKALERLEKKAAPVSAPLPGPIRQRQQRKAGYEEAKKEAEKWAPVVKANREAPSLRFTADKAAVPRVTTTAALAAKHTPETAMEAEVAALLEAAGAHSARAVADAEEALAMKALSVEEARERQNRLARMRALLFYHEVKAKRLKKTKSKEYRRKLKKAGQRRAGEGGEEGDEEQLRLDLEAAEFERAKERLTLKHRNTSRWARRALKRGQLNMDDGTRAAVAEQLRLGEELRQRVNRMKAPRGDGSDASTSASEDEGSDGGDGGDGAVGAGMSSKAKAAALELLQGGGEEAAPAKGLFALPFMQRALLRRRQEAQEAAQEALREMEGGGDDGGAGGGGRAGRLAFAGTGVDQRAQWERVARMEAAARAGDSDGGSDEDEDAEAKARRLGKLLRERRDGEEQLEEAEEQLAAAGSVAVGTAAAAAAAGSAAAVVGGSVATTDGPIGVAVPGPGSKRCSRARKAADAGAAGQQQQPNGGAAQPDWLFGNGQANGTGASAGGKREAGQQAVQVSVGPASGAVAERQQAGAAPPASAAQQEGQGQPAFQRSKTFQGARPGYVFKKGPQGVGYYLDRSEQAKASKKAAAAARAAARQQQQQQQQQRRQQAPDSDDEGNMRPMSGGGGGGGGGLSQAELVRAAFAGDDVAAEFAAAKAAEVEGELPQEEVAGVMPGWGTWAGQQREPAWVAEAKRKAEQRKASAAAARKDAKLQYVVISEKWDKKSSKYKTPSVPFPFDSRDTYERAMRQPLGREYNTDASFRDLTRPAVLKDAGVIIEPIRFSKAMAQYDEQAAKKRAPVTTVAGGMPKKSKKRA